MSGGRSSVLVVSIERGWRSGVRRVTALGLVPVGAGPCAAVGLRAVESMQVCFRRRNRATAMLLRSMHAAGRASAAESLNDELDPFSGDEVAAGLGWSRSMSGRWLELAEDLQRRLPGVLAVMDQGPLDEGKARAISEWTRDLCPAHAEEVCAQVLGCAPGLPLVALIERIQEVAIALDPGWAARREARARSHARVVGSANPSGTASVSGYDLPLDEAGAALSRVEAIAAEVRRRGVRIPIARLRATVYLRLLDGFSAGLDDDAVIRALVEALREPDAPSDNPPEPGPTDPGPTDDSPAGPDDPGPDDDGRIRGAARPAGTTTELPTPLTPTPTGATGPLMRIRTPRWMWIWTPRRRRRGVCGRARWRCGCGCPPRWASMISRPGCRAGVRPWPAPLAACCCPIATRSGALCSPTTMGTCCT